MRIGAAPSRLCGAACAPAACGFGYHQQRRHPQRQQRLPHLHLRRFQHIQSLLYQADTIYYARRMGLVNIGNWNQRQKTASATAAAGARLPFPPLYSDLSGTGLYPRARTRPMIMEIRQIAEQNSMIREKPRKKASPATPAPRELMSVFVTKK